MTGSLGWQEQQVKPFHYVGFLIVIIIIIIIFRLCHVGPKVEAEGWMGLHFLNCHPYISKGSPLGMGAEHSYFQQVAGPPMSGSAPHGENLQDPQI